jgi:hypothetical protein
MTFARTIALALVVVVLAASPALAQTVRPGPTMPGMPRPSTVDPRTGLPSSQAPTDPRTGLPVGVPGSLSTPSQPPPPIPDTGLPRVSPPAGQPITPSTVDPRTGLPR